MRGATEHAATRGALLPRPGSGHHLAPATSLSAPDWAALCGAWRGHLPGRGLTALSLYSGAGGLDAGFLDAGFRIPFAIESDPHAVATYRQNLDGVVIPEDLPDAVSLLPPEFRPDIIIGGPPCQGFSVAGNMDPADPRSRHVHVFLDVVGQFRPAAFCMENVKALGAPRWDAVYQRLIRKARRLGYTVGTFVLNAADFTVPQARERLFVVGIRGAMPDAPIGPTVSRQQTVLEALQAIPMYGAAGNHADCTARIVLAKNPVVRRSPYQGSLLFNGSGRPLELDAVARTLPASMGGNGTPIVDQRELQARLADPTSRQPNWVVGHHARVLAGRADEDAPPAALRRITVEEAAALQSFPKGWVWAGPRNAQFRQVGNAVPPRLARYVALAVGNTMQELRQVAASSGPC